MRVRARALGSPARAKAAPAPLARPQVTACCLLSRGGGGGGGGGGGLLAGADGAVSLCRTAAPDPPSDAHGGAEDGGGGPAPPTLVAAAAFRQRFGPAAAVFPACLRIRPAAPRRPSADTGHTAAAAATGTDGGEGPPPEAALVTAWGGVLVLRHVPTAAAASIARCASPPPPPAECVRACVLAGPQAMRASAGLGLGLGRPALAPARRWAGPGLWADYPAWRGWARSRPGPRKHLPATARNYRNSFCGVAAASRLGLGLGRLARALRSRAGAR